MRKENLRQLFFIFTLLLVSSFLLFAEEYEEPIPLNTEITGVSGYPGMGYGLFPVATSFQYYRTDINLFRNSQFKSKFYFYLTYGFSNVNDSGREWNTGIPDWALTRAEKDAIDAEGYKHFEVGEAFRQYGAVELWFGQPFVKNPVEGSDHRELFEIRFGFNARYTFTGESLSLGAGGEPTFVDFIGNPKGMFAEAGIDNPIVAYPWLNGDRKVLSTYLYATLYFYPYRKIRESVQDGVYGYVTFEYSPDWLLNSVSPSGYTSSDYYRINAYLEEKLLLLDERQENNWNWLSIYFGHSNTFSHIGGDVIPYYKVPTSYLSTSINDRFWLHFMGPSFITPDCFTYLEVSLNNNFYFGNVVNTTELIDGVSYTGSFDITLHLRLFGFIRFSYDCSYTFARGIYASYPAWWQRATLNFTVAI